MKTLGVIVMVIGGFMALGAIGNDDYGSIYSTEATCSFSQNLMHAGIGLVITLIGFGLYQLAEKRS